MPSRCALGTSIHRFRGDLNPVDTSNPACNLYLYHVHSEMVNSWCIHEGVPFNYCLAAQKNSTKGADASGEFQLAASILFIHALTIQ